MSNDIVLTEKAFITKTYNVRFKEIDHSDQDELLQAVRDERYPARIKVMKKVIDNRHLIESLGADLIMLPISWHQKREREPWKGWRIQDERLYLGGIEERQPFRHEHGNMMESLYIGPLPTWVADKYDQAKEFFKKNELFVVSRHRESFDFHERPVPTAHLDPLLIGVDRQGVQYMLAAWDLNLERPPEPEPPKSKPVPEVFDSIGNRIFRGIDGGVISYRN